MTITTWSAEYGEEEKEGHEIGANRVERPSLCGKAGIELIGNNQESNCFDRGTKSRSEDGPDRSDAFGYHSTVEGG